MTNELDTTQAETMPMTTPSSDGLDLLQRQAEAMGAAHKLATVLCNTQMVPQTFRGKPDDGAAAILYGAELGLKPQQALQQVFVVHGQPAIYARTMVALLKAKGYNFTTDESTDESVTVTAISPRGEEETSTWTIDRAKKAGYTSNKKYATDPQAMLYAKAASEVARRIAPDVLLGIRYTAEDLELEPAPIRATAERVRPERGAQGIRQALESKPNPDGQLDKAKTAALEAASHDQLDRIMSYAGTTGMPQNQLDELAELVDNRRTELDIEQES